MSNHIYLYICNYTSNFPDYFRSMKTSRTISDNVKEEFSIWETLWPNILSSCAFGRYF